MGLGRHSHGGKSKAQGWQEAQQAADPSAVPHAFSEVCLESST